MHLIEGTIKIILKAPEVFIFEFFCVWMKCSFIVFQKNMHENLNTLSCYLSEKDSSDKMWYKL